VRAVQIILVAFVSCLFGIRLWFKGRHNARGSATERAVVATERAFPEELRAPPPRQTKPKTGFLLIFSLYIAGELLFGVGFFVSTYEQQIFRILGKQTEGIIVGLQTRATNGSPPYTFYSVDYTYSPVGSSANADGGKPLYHEAAVSGSDYSKLKVGQKILVFYASGDPTRAELLFDPPQGKQPDSARFVPYMIALLMFAVLLIPLRSALRYFKEKALLVRGRRAQAFDVEKKAWSCRRVHYVNLIYKFRDDSGAIIRGASLEMPADLFIGREDFFTVLYDPNNSSKNSIYPFKNAQIADL